MQELVDRITQALADRYRIERELGEGGMATVYLAEDLTHHRKVAIKVLKPQLAAVLGVERFLLEIEITATLTHPHIMPLLDSGEAEELPYYVMPYVEDESLRDRLVREKQLPIDDALQITRDVTEALTIAHAHNVIHRDIKPENVLLAAGHAVVTDFGLARAITVAGEERITGSGFAVGTPAYMSPEQAAGDLELDARSDVYSLACMLYEMVVGELPFTGATAQAAIAKRLQAPIPHAATVRESVPPTVDAAISKALSKAPEDRFATAAEFADALAAAPAPVSKHWWSRPRK